MHSHSFSLCLFLAARLSRRIAFVFGIAAAWLAITVSAQEYLVNGSIETFTSGVPTGWTGTGGDGSLAENTTDKSPFTNRYTASTRCAQLTDGNVINNVGPNVSQTFPEPGGSVVRYSVDFRFATAPVGREWQLQYGDDDGSGVQFRFFARLDSASTVRVARSGGTEQALGSTLVTGTWYQLELLVNYITGTYEWKLTPFGGATTSTGTLTGVVTTSRVDHVEVFDGTTSTTSPHNNATLQLDNFSAATVPPAPGDLDFAFGTGGSATTAIGTGTDRAQSLVLQSDGKILLAGYSLISGTNDFALVRYNANGSLDTTFNTTGKVTTAIGSGSDVGFCVALQSDGKIIVAGNSYNGSNDDFALVRYNTNGSLDSSFGTGGKVTTAFGSSDDGANSMVLQSDGKIVVAGYTKSGSLLDIAVARYTSSGVLDSTFGTGGKVTTNIVGYGADDVGKSVALQSDGRIVVAGYTHAGATNDVTLVRYNANGSLDTSFNSGGLQPGTLTIAYGPGDDEALSVLVQSDGKIVVTGDSSNGSNFDVLVARFTSTGASDSSFGTGGRVITPIGTGHDFSFASAVQSDGKIVAAGYSFSGSTPDFALARYTSGGVLESSFGTGGKVVTPIGSGSDLGYGVALQSDGKIVLAGYSNNGTKDNFALARYQGFTTTTTNQPGIVNTTNFFVAPTAGLAEIYNATTDITATGYSSIGQNGVGVLNQTAGAHSTPNFFVGENAGAGGTCNHSAGAVTVAVGGLSLIGNMGQGTYDQTGGTHTAPRLFIGSGIPATGLYRQRGGALNITGELKVGSQGVGRLEHSSGSVSATPLTMGDASTGTGSYALTGGTLTTSNSLVGHGGSGTFTQSGGTHTVTASVLLGDTGTGTGIYNLEGGTLTTATLTIATVGTGTLVVNGGTLNVTNLQTGTGTKTLVFNKGTISATTVNMSLPGANGLVIGDGTNAATFNLGAGSQTVAQGFHIKAAGTLSMGGSNAGGLPMSLEGGTLTGNGSTGVFTATSGSEIDLGGTATATLTTTDNLTLATGVNYKVDLIGTTTDQLNVQGTVNLANATLSVTLRSAPTIGQSFIIVQNDGTDGVSGTFAGLPEGSILSLTNVGSGGGIYNARVSYVGGTGNDVTLLIVNLPTVTSPTATSFAATRATLGGNVTSDGGSAITERGVVYSVTSVNSNPVIGGSGVTKVAGTGTTGLFSVSATGLAQGTGYSYKAYATTSQGTGYSAVASFTTLAAPVNELLLIASGGRVLAFNAASGAYLSDFISGYNPGFANQIEIGPDGDLYVNDFSPQQVHRFDGTTGQYKGLAVQYSGASSSSMAFGPDGNLHLGLSDRINAYNVQTGAFVRTLVLNPVGLSVPAGILFDGSEFYVSYLSGGSGAAVYRFDAATGGSPTALATGLFGNGPRAPLRNGDGRLLVPIWQTNDIAVFSAGNPVFQGNWSAHAAPAQALATGVDGNLLVLIDDGSASHVKRINSTTGALLGTFIAQGTGGLGRAGDFARRSYSALPVVTLTAPSAVGATTATLNGTVNPSGGTTTAQFQYGLTTSYGSIASVTLSPNNGTTAQAVSAALSGLTPGTLYHYRLNANNAFVGTSSTSDGTFTTISAPEIAIEQPLGTNIDDGGSKSFGSVATSSSASLTFTIKNTGTADLTLTGTPKVVVSGTDAALFTVTSQPTSPLTGPSGSTTFTVSFSPTSAGGKTAALAISNNDGDENPFDILISGTGTQAVPSITLASATNIAATTATLNGTVNPNGGTTTAQFQYGPTISYGSTANVTLSPNNGTTAQNVSANLSSLTPSTLYHYRLSATNSAGTANSSDATFTTPAASSNNNLANLTVSAGTLSPAFSPSLLSYSVTVPFSVTTFSVTPTLADLTATVRVNGTVVPSGSASTPTALNPGTNSRSVTVTAQNGNIRSISITITRTAPPQVSTGTAGAITNLSAVLHGTATSFGSSTAVTFEYGLTTSYGNTVTAAESPSSSFSGSSVSALINGLTPNTTYHYRIKGSNAEGTLVGTDLTFTTRSSVPAGMVDPAFDPNADGTVTTVATQPDGKLVLGGSFNQIGGSGSGFHACMARVGSSGAVDTGFNAYIPNFGNGYVIKNVCVQADGNVLAGGYFNSVTLPGVTPIVIAQNAARFSSDGRLDVGFKPQPDAEVRAIHGLTNQDKVSLVGNFFNLSDSSGFTHFMPGGYGCVSSTGFVLSSGFADSNDSREMTCLADEGTGSFLVGGGFGMSFSGNTGTGPRGLARLAGDLNFKDLGFSPRLDLPANSVAVQPDGKLLVGGYFASFGATVSPPSIGTPISSLVRLNANGSLDSAFAPQFNGSVWQIALQADGKILIAGSFTTVSGVPRNGFARLLADGTVDTTFDPDPNGSVNAIAVQADGSIVIGGDFTRVGGIARNRVARLLNDSAAQSLSLVNSTTARWTRTGAGPDLLRARIEKSTDGLSWTLVGDATRIAGGWQVTSASMPTSGYLRARGLTIGGNSNGTSGYMEQVIILGLPTVTSSAATNVIANASTLNGTVNPNGTATTARFEYGLTTSYGSTANVPLSPNNGTTAQTVSAVVSGLSPNTVYHYRLSATNTAGTVATPDDSFTTSSNYTVEQVTVSKSISFLQNSFSNVIVDPTPTSPSYGGPYGFAVSVAGPNVVNLSSPPTVTGPFTPFHLSNSGTIHNGGALVFNAQDAMWRYGSPNASDWGSPTFSDLNDRFGSGNYTVRVGTTDVPLSLTGDIYPITPSFSLGGGAWSGGKYYIAPTQALTVTTSIHTSYGSHVEDFVASGIEGITEQTAFASASPAANYLTYQVPANTLTPGQEYHGWTSFGAVSGINSSALPSTLSAAFYEKQTKCTIVAMAVQQGWRQRYFGTSGNSGDAADTFDFDHDGLPNLIEFGFDLNPTAASVLPATTALNGAFIEFTYTRSAAAINAGVTFAVEWSDTLPGTSWSTSGVSENILFNDGTVQQVKALVPAGSQGRRFVHLTVTAPP